MLYASADTRIGSGPPNQQCLDRCVPDAATLVRQVAAWQKRRNAATGALVQVVSERSRQDDCLACFEALGALWPDAPKLLVWDNAPPHQPERVM